MLLMDGGVTESLRNPNRLVIQNMSRVLLIFNNNGKDPRLGEPGALFHFSLYDPEHPGDVIQALPFPRKIASVI